MLPDLPGASTGTSPFAGVQRGRVWVVDDSPTELARARALLARHYVVECFEDGEQGLEALAQRPAPDVLLLDWQLPGASGVEVCRFVRQRHDEVSLPILLLTARTEAGDVEAGFAAGANDYVTKPYRDAELLARVATLVRVRHQAEVLRLDREWFSALLTSIGDAVIATGQDGHITFLNPVAERLTGWAPAEALGRPVSAVFRLLDAGAHTPVEGPIEQLMCGRAPTGLPHPILLVRRDATQVPVDVMAAPLCEGERLVGAILVFRDITDRRRLEEEARVRSDFEKHLVGIVSHDLRNPLQAILMSAASLGQRVSRDEGTTRAVQRIQASAERATRLIRDLLDFTQARLGGGIRVERKPVDLHLLVRLVVDEVQTRYPACDIRLETEGGAEGEWDADRLAQVVTNLAANAVRHGPADTPVTVRTRAEGDWVTLAVHNAGAPIPPEVRAHLFQPMQRTPSPRREASGSVGLGLFIVDHIVRAHGGTIDVQSSEQEGTTFQVRLPRRA